MNKTRKVLALALSILFFSSIGVLYAIDTIYTPNIITVTGHQGYELGPLTCNNTDPVVNSTITFTGYLLSDGQGIAAKVVKLYNTTTPAVLASWTECGQGTTNSTGYYNMTYVFPIKGEMYFKGGYTPT